MTRERKTIDTYELHLNYGQGWEHELTEHSIYGIRNRRREYRENCPQYPTKVKSRRVNLTEYTPEQLATIKQEIEADREEYNKHKAAK